MKTVQFTVPGDPQGQPRPRARAVPDGRGGFTATVYQPERERGADGVVRDLPITTWRRAVAAEVAKVLPPEPWTGTVKLDVVFYLPRTVEMEKKKHADGLIPHISKPDLDNALKAIMDELVEQRTRKIVTRRGILRDDAQICELHTRKWWAERGTGGGAHVVLTRLGAATPALPFQEPKRTHVGGFKISEVPNWSAEEVLAALHARIVSPGKKTDLTTYNEVLAFLREHGFDSAKAAEWAAMSAPKPQAGWTAAEQMAADMRGEIEG